MSVGEGGAPTAAAAATPVPAAAATPGPTYAPAPGASTASAPTGPAASVPSAPTGSTAASRPRVAREAEPIDLMETAGLPVLKAAAPAAAGLVVLLLAYLVGWRRGAKAVAAAVEAD